jgi:uncharacterized protein
MPRITRDLSRRVAWQGLEPFPSLEVCRLSRLARGLLSLEGTVAHSADDRLALISYTVITDTGWRTGEVHVHLTTREQQRSLVIEFDEDVNKIWVDLKDQPDLHGCIDADLEFSPCTNTLPIRRLGLGIGESADVRAAWVRFPGLRVEPLDQVYTRTGERAYRYRSGSFEAELEVDDEGLVIDYPGIWRRLPPS